MYYFISGPALWEPSDRQKIRQRSVHLLVRFCFVSVFLHSEKDKRTACPPTQKETRRSKLGLSKRRKSRLEVRAPLSSLETHVTQRAPGPEVTWGRVRQTQGEPARSAHAPEPPPAHLGAGREGERRRDPVAAPRARAQRTAVT